MESMESKRGFKPAQYLTLSQDHLVAVALWYTAEEGREPSFENLVAEAYLSFPERFQLEGYPQWPNAHVVGKAWVRCRTDKKWITGSASTGFALTPIGEQVVRKTLSKLRNTKSAATSERHGSRQTISSRVVLGVENSPAYRRYKCENLESISEYEFCELLYCTLESTPETVNKNFEVVRQQVAAYGRRDMLDFLEKLKAKFAGKFVGKRSRGGLMPQKKEV
jgi:hypothetical protein